jgi:hypothetical protein
MENTNSPDLVRAKTSPESLEKIDRAMHEKVLYYSSKPREVLSRRIAELDREWDIERILEANASSLALTGVFLGVARGRKYLLLSAAVMGFLLTHAIQGWCPPLPALRKLGVRTRAEIDQEKFALKVLRGDFQNVSHPALELKTSDVRQVINAVGQS